MKRRRASYTLKKHVGTRLAKKKRGRKHEKFQFAKKRFRPFSLTLFIFNEFSVSVKHLKDTLKDWKAGKQRGSIETSKFE